MFTDATSSGRTGERGLDFSSVPCRFCCGHRETLVWGRRAGAGVVVMGGVEADLFLGGGGGGVVV